MTSLEDMDNPNSNYNRKCLRDLRRKYRDMTAEEMISRRKASMRKIRASLRAAGHYVPDDDAALMREMKRLGVV